MKEQLVSYKTVKLAQKIGIEFRGPLFSSWRNVGNKAGTYHAYVPQSALQKYLREVHKISIKIDDFYTDSKIRFDFSVSLLGSQEDNPQGIFEFYEEALEAGLQEALKSIKIVKE